MNQHLRASLMTIVLLSLIVAVATFFHVMSMLISADMIPVIIAVVGIGVCIFLIYMMFLHRIRYEDQVKSMVDRK